MNDPIYKGLGKHNKTVQVVYSNHTATYDDLLAMDSKFNIH